MKLKQANNNCKRVLETVKLFMLIKQKGLLLTRKLALVTFGELQIVFLIKVNCYKSYT